MTKRSFTGKGLRAKTPLELVHSDLCGPMNVKARGGYEYFISFIDDYSRYDHVYLIQNKSDSFEKFKEYKAEVENESDRPSLSTKVVDKTRNIGQTHPSQELEEPRRSRRVVRQPDRYLGLSEAQIIIPDDGIEDPLSYKQAMNDVDCDQWIKAMDLEMESIYSNSVWTLVDQQREVRPIGCKWIYKRKRDQAGKVQTFKARLVAKGYTQKEGIYYEETFSPVAMNSKKGLLPYRYGIHLSKEQCPKIPQEVEDMSNIPYASAVGSLMYATLCTRPDICYSVGIVSRYQSNPGQSDPYWIYTDSDFQIDKDARKSTLGSFTLNGGAVVRRSIKQSCIADSTCEAAKRSIANSREPRNHKCGKHIERKYHLIREIVHPGDAIVTKISSEQNMVDPFTKALTAKVFESHLYGLGLRSL
ncbi:gag/pol protein [Cucumis melo var. makuwa]|uniref:Gag/pol protein n=1 Tax=Cucumis melo var. makuwa TaxID=1194695 RepID=A0A5D3BBP2_CUCMM|nr:gag/pol protein [Cucumis melo var. makuwa]